MVKRIFFVCIMLCMLFPAVNAFSESKQVTFEVEGMAWGDSENRVSSILDQYKSITNYETDTGAESATIFFDDQTLDVEALREELSKAGFPPDGL